MVFIPQFARHFHGGSVNWRIFRAAASVAAAGILVKVVATFKEFAVAGVYGRSDAMDAFLAAFLIPNLLINLISESMNQALVPTLIRVREREGHERAQQLLSSSMLWVCLLLTAAMVAMALGARGFFPLIASHFGAEKLALSIRLFYALLPVVLITGIATNCTAVLNTFDRFAVPALAPMATPAAIIVGALVWGGRYGIWAMVYATLIGALLHAGVVAWMMDRRGYRFRLWWHGATEATREVARQYGPVLLSGVVASGGLLVDQSMAAMLPAGSVSALAYANRFVSVVVTLLAGAVSSAVVPHFSRMIAHEDWAGCRHTLRTWVTADGAGFDADCAGADCRLTLADPHGLPAWGLWAARHGAGDAGADDVRDSDSVFCLQPGLLPLSGGAQALGSDFLLRRAESGAGYCAESGSDALDGRGGDCAGHFAVDGKHLRFPLVLELEAAAQGDGRGDPILTKMNLR